MKKVGVIGGSGFIGSYITKQFLDNGFEVKVSATDLSKEEKYQHLKQLDNANHLTISELNIENKAQLKTFVDDCDIVIHGGTPFQLDVEDPKRDLFDPTIKGTENFLDVVHNAPKVKKVVLIASVAAYNTNFPLPPGEKEPSDHFSENDTPFTSEESHPYAQAKFIANETVNTFISQHPKLNVEITSVSPVAVFGKSLSKREDSVSTGLQFLIKNKLAPNPFVQMLYDTDAEMAIVNVNDVAHSVYKAANISGLHGKNYLLSSETYPVSDVNLMLNNKAPKNQAKVIYQNKLAERELGITFQSVHETLDQYNS
ncbi:NAD-dependent epimerase/dehydratase family protein [Psychroserpens burtonensis]|uniref:NAD-dependent epimerase/dehydratase family protein n=1 Tax=Psychroserpens burtonensis TaxID=49278 RepID=A0A5C7BAJ6_9FLAO|nr:NAD-dependent epimerase/dehydratase family protein [Psychroserpens burtonensis]TXE18777.1 NAD-dependent epimerase/dehydratase family protein [Psychroserpens burtonensis]